jgi:dihydrodipicolinate synthase/N-acetylneuraminate lyase
MEEHCELIKVAVEHANRIPIIAGTGGNSTAEAIELTAFAKKVGADASLQVVPTTTVRPRKACTCTSRPSPKRWICR